MKSSKKFVIQKHTKSTEAHWDLMFDIGDTLKTYRLTLPPEKLRQQTCPVVKIFDHPIKFLTYEGSVNNGKGSVKIADAGTYQLLNDDYKHQLLLLNGKILKGKFTLTRIEDDNWQFGPC
jgi:bifunctional non-homologous end joining protein LigD